MAGATPMACALLELGADQNSTIVFPLPLDILTPLIEAARSAVPSQGTPPAEKAGEPPATQAPTPIKSPNQPAS